MRGTYRVVVGGEGSCALLDGVEVQFSRPQLLLLNLRESPRAAREVLPRVESSPV